MIKAQLARSDESMIRCHEFIACERVKRGLDKETISFRRFTKMNANLIMTDTSVRERLINAIVEDDRRKNE